MESEQSQIEKHTKIMVAVGWKSESEQPEFGDANYKSFCQVMEYRREVAKRYLEEKDGNAKLNIEAILNYCNEKIRQILGV